MKKLVSLLALALLVSSCGNKLTLMKRHYTKGYYVHNSKQADKTVAHTAKAKAPVRLEPTAPVLLGATAQPELSASIKIVGQDKARGYQHQLVRSQVQNVPRTQHLVAPSFKHAELKALKQSQARKGDANLLVMVILALFPILCLIAVYLHDGGITTNFWIDLILHITVIGEIIFALLVVLDVVNFA